MWGFSVTAFQPRAVRLKIGERAERARRDAQNGIDLTAGAAKAGSADVRLAVNDDSVRRLLAVKTAIVSPLRAAFLATRSPTILTITRS